jgi:regulatory protein
MALTKNKLTPLQALERMKHYCSYSERSHKEVQQRLAEHGVYGADADNILATLIEENYLNEERFATQFAGGKHRNKNWGKQKILAHLKQKGVTSSYLIKNAMAAIDENDYNKTLLKIATKKWALLKGEQYLVRKKKLQNYLLQKGYEIALINKTIEALKEI